MTEIQRIASLPGRWRKQDGSGSEIEKLNVKIDAGGGNAMATVICQTTGHLLEMPLYIMEANYQPVPQAILDYRGNQAAWHRAEANAWECGDRDATSAEVARIATGAASVDLVDEQGRTANGATPTRRKAFYDAVYKASEAMKTEAVDRVAMKGGDSDA